jgi:uncharacterized protein YndB with AHSA1/START domain
LLLNLQAYSVRHDEQTSLYRLPPLATQAADEHLQRKPGQKGRPKGPYNTMHELPSGKNLLILQGDFEAFSPQELFDYWVTPSLVTQWWAVEAEIVPGQGGSYKLSWPEMGWELQGVYKEFNPPEKIVFTWHWNHEPVETDPLQVSIDFDYAANGGTMLTITHGRYDDTPAAQAARQGHLEGWIHFCMKLAGLREGIQDSVLMRTADSDL